MLERRKICSILHLIGIIGSVYADFDPGLESDAIEDQCLELYGYQRSWVPIKLTRVKIGTWNNVELVRHHIIPERILRDFFDYAVKRNKRSENIELNGIINLMGVLSNYSLRLYPGHNSLDQNIRYHLHQLKTLRDLYTSDTILKNPSLDVLFDERYFAYSLFQWIPANIFIGPNFTTNNTGNQIEPNCKHIIGQGNFERLQMIRILMLSYIETGSHSVFKQVIDSLCQISRERNIPYGYNPDDWKLNSLRANGTKDYCIANDRDVKRNLTLETQADKDPYCLKPIEKLKMHIENKNLMIIAAALKRTQAQDGFFNYKYSLNSWKDYYASQYWSDIFGKGTAMCVGHFGYRSYGYQFDDDSFAIGILGADILNRKDNWIDLAYPFNKPGTANYYAGQAFFDKNGRPVAIVFSYSLWADFGVGYSFVYNGGKWEYEANEKWHETRFAGRTESLDLKALRFFRDK